MLVELSRVQYYTRILIDYYMTIQELSEHIMAQAKVKGFGVSPADIDVAEKIALIHSEVSEAFEAYRHKNIDGKDGLAEELGDVVQRVVHLAAVLGIDLEKAISDKLAFNDTRTWDWSALNEKNNDHTS